MRPSFEAGPSAGEAGITVEGERKPGKTALVFTGQGSQRVGMGIDFHESSPAARAVFNEADYLAKQFGLPLLSQTCFEGPANLLNNAVNAPLAILTVSVAGFASLRERMPKLEPLLVAGHSAGEIAATVAAGILDFQNAFLVMKERSVQTNEVVQTVRGAMAAVRIKVEQRVFDLLNSFGVVAAAINSEEDITVSGEEERLDKALSALKAIGAKFRRLDIAGAFHHPMMGPAKVAMAKFLEGVPFNKSHVEIVLNNGKLCREPDEVRRELPENLVSPVLWKDVVQQMLLRGVTHVIEIGPQLHLSGFVKKNAPSVKITGINNFHAVQKLQLEGI